MKAKFKCLKCDYKWTERPAMVSCPKCNHKYVKWINYETMHRKHFKKMYDDEKI